MDFVFSLFCLTLPLTDVGIGSTGLPLPTALAFICFFFLFISGAVSRSFFKINKQDLIFLLFFISSICSLLLSVQGIENKKVINHFFARPVIFLIFFWSIRFFILKCIDKTNNLSFLKWVTLGVLVSCVYSMFEFIEMNVTHTNFTSLIPRLNYELEYGATAIGSIIRSRSFVEESGHFAFYLELIGPLALYYTYFKFGKAHFYMMLALILLSILSTLSSTTFMILPLGVILAAMVCRIKLITIVSASVKNLFSTLILIIITILSYYTFVPLLIKEVTTKLTVGDIGGRAPRILDAWNVMLDASFSQWIFGYGPASFYHFGLDGILSLYMSCLFELGISGLFLLLLFIMYSFRYCLFISDIYLKYTLILSLILSLLHFIIIQNYWYPWFWFVIAFISACNARPNISLQLRTLK